MLKNLEILFGEPGGVLGGLAGDMLEAITQILSDGDRLICGMDYKASWDP